jgi:PAS domain-containing protein
VLREIVTQILVDLVILTGLLNASGGIENPLAIAYLFHVIIAGILLPTRKTIGIALTASAIFTLLALGKLLHVFPHSTILLFPHSPSAGHIPSHAAHDLVFVTGRVVSFVGVMLLTSYFTTLVTGRLHRSEAELERAARKAALDHSRLEGVIDAAGLGIVVIGRDLIVQWFNPRVGEWMAWSDGMCGVQLRARMTAPCRASRVSRRTDEKMGRDEKPKRVCERRDRLAASTATRPRPYAMRKDTWSRSSTSSRTSRSARRSRPRHCTRAGSPSSGNSRREWRTRLEIRCRRCTRGSN